jgi:hypothetical protein
VQAPWSKISLQFTTTRAVRHTADKPVSAVKTPHDNPARPEGHLPPSITA